MECEYPEGATPLDPSELEALIPSHITTLAELNSWEYRNIVKAHHWLVQTTETDIISVRFVQLLHKKMFDDTWRWAGQFRQTEKNLGVNVGQIQEEVFKLCEDARFWCKENTFAPDELAVRFHRKLVWIHPFPNGNGRHARLMADLVAEKILGRPRFSWGGIPLAKEGKNREKYIEALQAADRYEIGLLLKFARS